MPVVDLEVAGVEEAVVAAEDEAHPVAVVAAVEDAISHCFRFPLFDRSSDKQYTFCLTLLVFSFR